MSLILNRFLKIAEREPMPPYLSNVYLPHPAVWSGCQWRTPYEAAGFIAKHSYWLRKEELENAAVNWT